MGKEKPVEVSKFKAQICVAVDGTSTIFRPNLPFIVDKTEASVTWLKQNGFKESEIEIVGEKLANWDAVFNPAKKIEVNE